MHEASFFSALDPRQYPKMRGFLKSVHPARMFVRSGVHILPLAPLQLYEILCFQANKPYNKDRLIDATDSRPYFLMFNAVRTHKYFVCYTPVHEAHSLTMDGALHDDVVRHVSTQHTAK